MIDISLCGKLEDFIGGYFLSGVLPGSNVETLYYDASIDSVYEDDFLTDVSIPFDYEAFEIIDSKVDYLNPKNFSVYQLVRSLKSYRNMSMTEMDT